MNAAAALLLYPVPALDLAGYALAFTGVFAAAFSIGLAQRLRYIKRL